MVRPGKPQASTSLVTELSEFFLLSRNKVTKVLSTRAANDSFDLQVFDEWHLKLAPKAIAWQRNQVAMRRGSVPVADLGVAFFSG